MSNSFDGLSPSARWHLMVAAAKKAMESKGYLLDRVPGRGLSNMWKVTKNGDAKVVSIRTTQDRWIAFPPLEDGSKWKTLDDVARVVVATVDSKEQPNAIEVYDFPAGDVRNRFDAAYAARIGNGQTVKNNFGMWVGLDHDDRGIASSVGSGIVDHYEPIARFSIDDLRAENTSESEPADNDVLESMPDDGSGDGQSTIAEVMAWARERVAQLAGVKLDAVKLDLKIEY